MNNKKDGGPAFPLEALSWVGMSVRDYFAAAAMLRYHSDISSKNVARWSYEDADAMLRERKKESK